MIFGFSEPDVPQISVDEVKKLLDDKKDVTIVDVRTPEEFSRNHLHGAINIPIDEIEKIAETKIPQKDTPLVVYCLSGSRSVHGVDQLLKKGYTDVKNISHGLLAWRVKHFPVEE